MNKGVKDLVKWFLENEIETRSDDDLLCALVDARIKPQVMVMSYFEVAKNLSKHGLPSHETITRVRRELQEDFPHLRGCDPVTRRRFRREKEYREYYREKKYGEG